MLGPHHDVVAATLQRLGSLHAAQGEHELAREAFVGVLAVCSGQQRDAGSEGTTASAIGGRPDEGIGPGNENQGRLAEAYEGIAEASSALGEHEEALASYDAALASGCSAYGDAAMLQVRPLTSKPLKQKRRCDTSDDANM